MGPVLKELILTVNWQTLHGYQILTFRGMESAIMSIIFSNTHAVVYQIQAYMFIVQT